MIKFPIILAALSILGISISQIIPLPDNLNEFKVTALLTLITLSVLIFCYKVISKKEEDNKEIIVSIKDSHASVANALKDNTDASNRLTKSISEMPCLLIQNKPAIAAILSQLENNK